MPWKNLIKYTDLVTCIYPLIYPSIGEYIKRHKFEKNKTEKKKYFVTTNNSIRYIDLSTYTHTIMEQTRNLRPTPKISRPVNKKIFSLQSSSTEDLIIEALTRLNYGKGSTRYCVKHYIKTKYPSTKMSEINQSMRNGVDNGFLEQPEGPNGLIRIADVIPTAARGKMRRSNRATLERQGMKRNYEPIKPSSHHVTHELTLRQMLLQGITSVNNGTGTSRERLKEYIADQYFKNREYDADELENNLENTINKAIDDDLLIEPDGPLGVLRVSTLKKVQVALAKQGIESK